MDVTPASFYSHKEAAPTVPASVMQLNVNSGLIYTYNIPANSCSRKLCENSFNTLRQWFSTGVPLEFLKHAIPDYNTQHK